MLGAPAIYISSLLAGFDEYPNLGQNRKCRQYSPRIMDPVLPMLSYSGILGRSFGHVGGPGSSLEVWPLSKKNEWTQQ